MVMENMRTRGRGRRARGRGRGSAAAGRRKKSVRLNGTLEFVLSFFLWLG